MKNLIQLFAFFFGMQSNSEPIVTHHYHYTDNKKVFVDGVEIYKTKPEILSKRDFVKYMLIKKNIICL